MDERPSLEPKETGVASAGVRLLLPPRDGLVVAVRGLDTLDADPNVVRHRVRDVAGSEVHVPRDNNDYLGHVVAVDRRGLHAGAYAEQAVRRVELVYADQVRGSTPVTGRAPVASR